MSNILLTGVATLDIINQLDSYPEEDSEVRASAQFIQSGGNASNSALVIQQLGLNAYLLANRADDINAEQIFSALNSRKINTSLCPLQKHSSTPTSYITLNTSKGSRSIVHYRDLQELAAEIFLALDLSTFDWLHFEARECDQLIKMLPYARSYNIPISIELEKPRQHIDNIMQYADLLFISKPFAISRGFNCATTCLEHFSTLYNKAIITCTWGEQGAWAYHKSRIIHQPADKVEPIVETLGAGDTFNGGFIHSFIKHNDVSTALEFACRLAANKCRQRGFDHLQIPD